MSECATLTMVLGIQVWGARVPNGSASKSSDYKELVY